MNNFWYGALKSNIENSVNYDIGSKKIVSDMELWLSNYKFDNNQKGNFLWIGDSVVEGAIEDKSLAYFNKFANAVDTRQYGSGATKYPLFASDYATYPTVLSITGTWDNNAGNTYSTPDQSQTDLTHASGWLKTTVANSTFTIASQSSYKFKVLFACGNVFDGETAGSISIVIDGGAPEVIDLAQESGNYFWKEFDAPTTENDGNIVITAVDNTKYVAIQIVHMQASHVGLNFHNIAVPGSGAFHWVDRLNIIDAYAPKLSFVGLGANDILKGQTIDQYETNMRLILNKLASYGQIIYAYYACFVSGYSGLTATEFARIEPFREKARQLALEYDALFLDFQGLFVDGATATSNGYISDGIHLLNTGHEVSTQYMLSKVYVS